MEKFSCELTRAMREVRQMDVRRKAEIRWTWLSDGEAATPQKPNAFIIYRRTGRQTYCIQQNREAGPCS